MLHFQASLAVEVLDSTTNFKRFCCLAVLNAHSSFYELVHKCKQTKSFKGFIIERLLLFT